MKFSVFPIVLLFVFTASSVHAQPNEISIVEEVILAKVNSPKVVSFTTTIKNKKVLLDWTVANNEKVDEFIIQRITGKKKYKMVGLVFGSDLAEQGNYQFFEALKDKKASYRIVIIQKDNSAVYSDIVKATADQH